jgi:hypothetical protein
MTCNDASFEKETLVMEGFAGAITSSWHPILGALIHFTPRNSNRPEEEPEEEPEGEPKGELEEEPEGEPEEDPEQEVST